MVGGSAGGSAAAVGGLAGRGIWAQKSPEVGFLGVIGCAAAIETRRIWKCREGESLRFGGG